MKRPRFPLSSEQMELLLAFQEAETLEQLAQIMAKDVSVVSRNLQKLASDLPVLTKSLRRWRLTALGLQVNELNRLHLRQLEDAIAGSLNSRASNGRLLLPSPTVLLAINTQKALHDPVAGRRNNTQAERNIRKLLLQWRKLDQPIIHIKHLSDAPGSRFRRDSVGFGFMRGLEALRGEFVLEKKKSSAFAGTGLEKHLRKSKAASLVLVGFTGGECIDATARNASDLGFKTFVVSDATATFEITGPGRRVLKADDVHQVTLANLQAHYAEILETGSLLERLAVDASR